MSMTHSGPINSYKFIVNHPASRAAYAITLFWALNVVSSLYPYISDSNYQHLRSFLDAAYRKEQRWKYERDFARAMHVAAERARERRNASAGPGIAQGFSFYAREEKRSSAEIEVLYIQILI